MGPMSPGGAPQAQDMWDPQATPLAHLLAFFSSKHQRHIFALFFLAPEKCFSSRNLQFSALAAFRSSLRSNLAIRKKIEIKWCNDASISTIIEHFMLSNCDSKCTYHILSTYMKVSWTGREGCCRLQWRRNAAVLAVEQVRHCPILTGALVVPPGMVNQSWHSFCRHHRSASPPPRLVPPYRTLAGHS